MRSAVTQCSIWDTFLVVTLGAGSEQSLATPVEEAEFRAWGCRSGFNLQIRVLGG